MKDKIQEEMNLDKIRVQLSLPYSGGIPSALGGNSALAWTAGLIFY